MAGEPLLATSLDGATEEFERSRTRDARPGGRHACAAGGKWSTWLPIPDPKTPKRPPRRHTEDGDGDLAILSRSGSPLIALKTLRLFGNTPQTHDHPTRRIGAAGTGWFHTYRRCPLYRQELPRKPGTPRDLGRRLGVSPGAVPQLFVRSRERRSQCMHAAPAPTQALLAGVTSLRPQSGP